MTGFLDSTRELAALGYFTFPCRPAGKAPLCAGGVDDAVRDERPLLHWADRWPHANVGIALGPSDVLVADIDPKHGASPGDVIGEFELDPETTVMVATGIAPEPCEEFPDSLAGERGAHLYFRGAMDSVTRTRLAGVELRSRGLYVIGPGGRHLSGVLYTGKLPPVRRLPEPPATVLELHAHGAETYGTGDQVVPDDGAEIEQGGRHAALLGWAMSRLYGRGVIGEAALAAMLAENQRRVRQPLEPTEVRRLWRWADKSRIAQRERALPPAPAGDVAALWGGHGLRRRR